MTCLDTSQDAKGVKRDEGEEVNYLAGAQPEVDPDSFASIVREAYLLEHDCVQDQEIAEMVMVVKSRVAQVLNHPEEIESKALDKFLQPLKSKSHRRRVFEAWALARFGFDLREKRSALRLGDTVTEKTIRRIDRQVREQRLDVAAETAKEALSKTDDWLLREKLLDRAYFARQRLDQSGHAMKIARLIAEGAKERNDLPRLAAAHLFRIRILMGMTDTKPEELDPLIEQARERTASLPPAASNAPYVMGDARMLHSLYIASRLTFMEQGKLPVDEKFLRSALQASLKEAAEKVAYQRKHRALQRAVRCHLLLGDTFQAQELLDQSFAAGGLKNLNTFEMCGILKARLLVKVESVEAASDYLEQVSEYSYHSGDRYHERLAEIDLVRIEATILN